MDRQEILEMYKNFRVTDVRDGMDWCGYHHYGSVHPGIKPLWRTRAIGFAKTVRYIPFEGPVPMVTGDEYTKWVNWYYDNVIADQKWIAGIEPGDFICMDVCGLNVGVMGSNYGLICKNAGAVGFVMNGGGIRDTDEVILEKIPVWSKFISQTMDQARIRFLENDRPIEIGGVAIYPNDLVVADGDGVIVVPNKIIYDVYKYASQEMKRDKVERRNLYIEGGLELDDSVDLDNI